MIEMKCKSCGGPLQVSPDDFIKVGEIAVQTCQTYRCPYCLNTFRRNEQFKLSVNMNIAHANVVINTEGGAYISGNLTIKNGADFVGRDNKVETIIIVQKS